MLTVHGNNVDVQQKISLGERTESGYEVITNVPPSFLENSAISFLHWVVAGPNTQKQIGFTGLGAKSNDCVVVYFALDNFVCREARERKQGGTTRKVTKCFTKT